MTTSSAPDTSPPPTPPTRSSRFSEGLRAIGKALWFLISILLYALGQVLYQSGRALIALSGWGPSETAPSDDASPPEPTANV